MRGIKWLLFGIALILLGIWCLLAAGDSGDARGFGWLAVLSPLIGIILCVAGMCRRDS